MREELSCCKDSHSVLPSHKSLWRESDIKNMKVRMRKDLIIEPMDLSRAPTIMFEVICVIQNACGKLGLGKDVVWLNAGTALGFWRDGDFIEGDTDVDLAVVSGQFGESILPHEILLAMWNCGFDDVRIVLDEDRTWQICFKKDGILVDIMFYYVDYVKNLLSNKSENGLTELYVEHVLPVQYKEFKGMSLPFPRNMDAWLTVRYGDEWRTPCPTGKPFFKKL